LDGVIDVGAVAFDQERVFDEEDILGVEFGAARQVMRTGDDGVVDLPTMVARLYEKDESLWLKP
jgi:hypothetical protein